DGRIKDRVRPVRCLGAKERLEGLARDGESLEEWALGQAGNLAVQKTARTQSIRTAKDQMKIIVLLLARSVEERRHRDVALFLLHALRVFGLGNVRVIHHDRVRRERSKEAINAVERLRAARGKRRL